MMHITNRDELAENLKGIREDRDLKHHDVAKALNISRSTYTYYETAKSLPSIFTLIQLAQFYHIDIRCFLFKHGENQVCRDDQYQQHQTNRNIQ